MKLVQLLFLLLPTFAFGQLTVEGIYPSNSYDSGEITVLLSNKNIPHVTGYTAFQLFNSEGDTLSYLTNPGYNLPRPSTSLSYQLRLKDGLQYLPDDLCGVLVLQAPALEVPFCLENTYQSTSPGALDCGDYELTEIVYAGEYWAYEVSFFLTSSDAEGAGATGNSSFQLFNSEGDSLTAKSAEIYSLPIADSDTIAYKLSLLGEIGGDSINLDSSCFELHVTNPDCILSICNLVSSIDQVNQDHIELFPNPFISTLYIDGGKVTQVEIYDLAGKLVYHRTGNSLQAINDFLAPSGVYTMIMHHQGGITTRKIVKR